MELHTVLKTKIKLSKITPDVKLLKENEIGKSMH